MEERKSFATFKDGHKEKIAYWEENGDAVLFATESGVYMYRPIPVPAGVMGLIKSTDFCRVYMGGKLALLDFKEEYNIGTITLDKRVECTYKTHVKGTGFGKQGTVLVAPDATQDEIEAAILKEIADVTYEVEEEN